MIPSSSPLSVPAAARARAELGGTSRYPLATPPAGYPRETELSRLIRYGCQFELEIHQMAELNQMRAENIRLRRNLLNGSTGSVPAAPPVTPILTLHR